MKKYLVDFAFAAILSLVLTNNAHAETRQDCIAAAADMYVAASIANHTGFRDMAEQYRPNYSTLANIRMETQISGARLRGTKIKWLATAHPDWLVTDEGNSAFINFSWPLDMSIAFLEASSSHVELDEIFQKWANDDCDEPERRAFNSWRVNQGLKTPEYKVLSAQVTEAASSCPVL